MDISSPSFVCKGCQSESLCLDFFSVLTSKLKKNYAKDLTQRQLYVFMALLQVSRLRVSADPQVFCSLST